MKSMTKFRERQRGETMIRLNQKQMEDKMVTDVLDNFDFSKCRITMRTLNWTWGFNNEEPSIFELKTSAEERMRSAIKYAKKSKEGHQSPYYVSSGGLKATVWKNMYNHIISVQLEFVLTDWDSDGDY
jgi:hypothetical protein